MLVEMQPFMVSFLIGLFIGIDRERSLPKGMKGLGVRSFIIVSLLGTMAASVPDIRISMIISSFVLAAILISYYVTSKGAKVMSSVGLTTTLTGGIVFCLGYMAKTDMALTAAIGVGIFILLLSRNKLHTFVHEKILPKEIRAAAALIVIFLCVVIFLPGYPIDPWGLFNPQRFGMLIAVIASLQFGGYVMIRLFGDQLGMLFIGFFGGLVSSTAVFVNLPVFLKNRPDRTRLAVAAGLLATVGMLLEFSIITALAAHELIFTLIIPIAVMILIGLISTFIIYQSKQNHQNFEEPRNPLDFKSVLYLSSIIGLMLVVVAFAKNYFGSEGVHFVTLLGGMFELHGVSLATATLYVSQKMTLIDAHNNLLLALLASFIPKFVLPWAFVRGKFAILVSCFLLLMIASGAAAAFLIPMQLL